MRERVDMKTMNNVRIVFLDWMRVAACFMVMAIHAAEPFYLGGVEPDITHIASSWDMLWITITECICRCCVPLFAMASAYLLFPLTRPTGEFFRRRIVRVVVPFAVWAVAYVSVFGNGGSSLGKQMSTAWANFARTGVPSADGLPVWEPYTREIGTTMLLDTTSQIVYHHDRELMKLLEPDYEY